MTENGITIAVAWNQKVPMTRDSCSSGIGRFRSFKGVFSTPPVWPTSDDALRSIDVRAVKYRTTQVPHAATPGCLFIPVFQSKPELSALKEYGALIAACDLNVSSTQGGPRKESWTDWRRTLMLPDAVFHDTDQYQYAAAATHGVSFDEDVRTNWYRCPWGKTLLEYAG
jgi:hypothetical protein